jgi:hypothetical protein
MNTKKKVVVEYSDIKAELEEVAVALESFKEKESTNIPRKLKSDITKLIKHIDQFTQNQ